MKQIRTVFKFEFLNYVKRKSFIALTVALVLIVAVTLSWGRISEFVKGGGNEINAGEEIPNVETPAEAEKTLIALSDGIGGQAGSADYYNAAYAQSGFGFVAVDASLEELEQMVAKNEYDSAIILTGPLSYIRVVRTIGMYDDFSYMFDEVMLYNYRANVLSGYDLSPEEINSFISAGIQSEVQMTSAGKDQTQSFFYTYVLIFLLYFAIMVYGQFVSSSVATEKSTRAMELLITSTKPNNLMFGKVLGTGFAGLTQLVAILGAAFLFYGLNKSYYADNYVIQSIFAMPVSILLYTILFFVLGFFIYAFLYASLASLVSRMEELATATMPVTMLFIFSFMISMFSMGFGNVDSTLMKVCSYVPLTSPMAMFARISMSQVAPWEIIISVAILTASTIGVGVLAARIYRLGVLMYGTPPNVKNIVKMLKKQ